MKYERLTTKDEEGNWQVWEDDYSHPFEALQVAIDRLAELEDKMENGTLIELPCKIGDTMYQVFHPSQVEPFPFEVEKIRVIIQADGIKVYVEEINGKGGTVGSMSFTREEAEKRLKELQE